MRHVAHYTADLELADREVVISPPLSRDRSDKLAPVPTKWQRLIVRGSSIETVNVVYRPTPVLAQDDEHH